MWENTYIVKKSLGDLVSNVYYFTDSTISLCWILNTNKKLRMYIFNRVSAIRRFIKWTLGEDCDIPLYHIDGGVNIADLLTKKANICPLQIAGRCLWQEGYSWQTQLFDNMPIKSY